MTPRNYHPPAIGGYCSHLAPCSTPEAPVPCTLTAHTHTIHCCANVDCETCHGGAVHAAAMMARRRAAAEQEQREMRAEMGGLDE